MPFKIEEKISESSFTSVYRAYDPVLKRNVLLKVLHKHLASDNDLYQRFVREAQACAALRSEHIVQVYDLIDYEGSPAIVLEYVDGTSLKNLIGTGTTRSLKYARKVALHTLRGLTVAHEKGIIHRDIKPGNILVVTDGTLKVTDFGLASLASVPSITAQGMVLGTPAYMSPEQIRHDEIDERTDLFSLGATLYEVLTGNRLFEGSSFSECAKKIISFKEDTLDELMGKSSVEFVRFLKLLLSPQKQNRYATSKDALKALDQDESRIFISIPHKSFKIKHKKVLIKGAAILAGIFTAALFIFNILSNYQSTKQINTSVIPDTLIQLKSDSSELSVMPKEKDINKPVAAPVPKDSGAVLLTSNPWAKVYIDSILIGETPISRSVPLAAGKHNITFMHPSFDPIIQTVSVEPKKELRVNADFIDKAGYINFIVNPWAEIYIDEQYRGTTPLEKPILVSPGKHNIRFKNSSFVDIIKEVKVKAKDTVSFHISFEKK